MIGQHFSERSEVVLVDYGGACVASAIMNTAMF